MEKLAVPVVLAALEALRMVTNLAITDYLVLPPLAVIVYLVFREPAGAVASTRSIVVLPTFAAMVGVLTSHYLSLTPASLALATGAVLLLQWILDAEMPPALALCVLAMFIHAKPVAYVAGVFEATVAILLAVRLWRLTLERIPARAANSAPR